MKIDGLKFSTEPWEHQLAALNFFMGRNYGALATAPGSGKTKVFIDLIVNRGFKRVIIVAPKKPCEAWERQIPIHAKGRQISAVSLFRLPKGKRASEALEACPGGNLARNSGTVVLIVNYERAYLKPLADILADKFQPDCVICDESHHIKKPGGRQSMYLAKLGRRAATRWLCSGSILGENPLEAYAQYRFMAPQIFGTNFNKFASRYRNLDAEKTMRLGYPVLNADEPYVNLDEFNEKFWEPAFEIPSTVKLPRRKNITVPFSMNAKGIKAYSMIEREGAIDTRQGELLIESALTKVLRRQQATSGFVQLENADGEKKLYNTEHTRRETLEELLLEFPKDEPIVIFAKFKKDLSNIRKACANVGMTYSEISGREDTEAEWQAGKTNVIGVQYKAASESVELVRARYIIFYSLTHSLTQYTQSKKRIHRPGQNRMCVYYHIVATRNGKPTIDQKILEALKKKQNILDEVKKGNTRL